MKLKKKILEIMIKYFNYRKLAGKDLSCMNLRKVNFKNVDMSNVNLSKAKLRDATFTDVNLSNANLFYSYLYKVKFDKVKLCCAYLEGCELLCTEIRESDLSGANLNHTDFSFSEIQRCDLRRTSLSFSDVILARISHSIFIESDLSGADFTGTDLIKNDFTEATLNYTDFHRANFNGSNLTSADTTNIVCNEDTAFYDLQCPEKGSFIGFKRADEYIVELEIPADAKRSSGSNRQCRCNKAKVISISNKNKTEFIEEICSDYDSDFIYKVGETVEVQDFNEDRWLICTAGIHFFITRDEAVRYLL